jgi:hypothetical protein
MDIIIFFIGGFVWYIALMKRELLIRSDSFRVILTISVMLFVAGAFLAFTRPSQDIGYGALLSPLMSLGLFRLFRKLFLMRYRREPRDTFMNWEADLGADRLFNIAYFMLAGLLWMVAPSCMEEVAKR